MDRQCRWIAYRVSARFITDGITLMRPFGLSFFLFLRGKVVDDELFKHIVHVFGHAGGLSCGPLPEFCALRDHCNLSV